jgi:hypothetical protein
MFRALGSFSFAGLTASAGTAITALLPPRQRAFTRLTRILYRCGGTAHAIVVLKSLAQVTLTANAASGQAVINISSDPGMAANKFVCVELADGTYHLGRVSSVSSLAVTLSANLPAAASSGAKVWFFGLPGDHPVSSQTTTRPTPVLGHTVTCTASILNAWEDYGSGIAQSNNQEEPLMVHSANGTAAGTFELISGCHTIN